MDLKPINILLVEDNPGDVRLVKELLDEDGERYNLVFADRLEEAIALLESQDITAILLDLQLPDGTGLETLHAISAVAMGVPIVVLSNIADERLAVQSVQHGAQDFLVKGHVNGHQLMRSLSYAIERKRMEERLNYIAHHDSLTGLANRKHFYDRLKSAMALVRRQHNLLALLLMDLNGFKAINDTLGHHVGDQLLQQVAQRLRECIRETDCAARIGGDEFTVILTGIRNHEDVAIATAKILEAMERPFLIEGQALNIYASIGISLYPTDADNLESLIRHADEAMYQTKAESSSSSTYRFYSQEKPPEQNDGPSLYDELVFALANGEFAINYQPQVNVRGGYITGMESLLRWQHPQRGLLLPHQFMPVLENTELMLKVGEWVLRTACVQGKLWQDIARTPVAISVNLAPRQLLQPDFADMVKEILSETGFAPHLLELDIPEHALWEDEDQAYEQVSRLNMMGVRLALDNFGNGRASFYYLRKFPFHAIKLDRRLTQDATSTTEGADMARAVIEIAHVFRMKGSASGVETAAQLDTLRSLAYDDAQGFLYCQPLPAAAATQLLERAYLEPAAIEAQ
ncbi:diguanylate cyclase [Novimethylophilus kurashikiensis]|uniref:Diguanylate cyclase n=1 Tax=Novimethylophilus kurashikiensis TaxID=1825523 RepID=A0A2R5F454_9PROT|nr:GGDEF domain-containing response regulator [Novimethylophilus kurashikiensis]GBG13216.1 diguanylate cyclase [Novimethylophilus kurashikiensis]